MTATLDISKVGFFHVDSPSSPVKSLREHLEAAREHLSDCVVVLPEAFNYPEFRSWTSFSVSLTCFYGRF